VIYTVEMAQRWDFRARFFRRTQKARAFLGADLLAVNRQCLGSHKIFNIRLDDLRSLDESQKKAERKHRLLKQQKPNSPKCAKGDLSGAHALAPAVRCFTSPF